MVNGKSLDARSAIISVMAFAAFLVNGLVSLITTCILELAILRWSLIVNLRSFQPLQLTKIMTNIYARKRT